MTKHFADVFRFHFLIWRLSGTWHGDLKSRAFDAYGLFLNALLVLFWVGIWHNLGAVTTMIEANDVLTFGSIFTMSSIKTLLFVMSRRRCTAILQQIDRMEADIVADGGQEERIVRRTATLMRRVGLVIGVGGCSAALTHLLITQVLANKDADGNRRRLLVFPASMPYNWKDNAALFYGTNVFQLTFALYSAIMLATLDIVGPHMYMTLRAFLEVLAVRSARIGSDGRRRDDVNYDDDDVGRKDLEATRKCIIYHMDCLRLGELVEEMYGAHYFVQFCVGSLGICTSAFVLSQISFLSDPANYLFIIICLSGQAAQIFIPCFYGSSLLTASERLSTHIYAAHWITKKRSTKTGLMLIFVERAKRPVALRTFAGLFRIELPMFVSVLRAAYSMLSFLTQMA